MTRNLILGAIVVLAFTSSPFTPKASADWQAYYDQLSKLESGPNKIRNSYSDNVDKLRAAQEKRIDNALDAADKIRGVQQAWLSRVTYPGYYVQPYWGTMPYYSYPVYPVYPSPSSAYSRP